MKEYPVQNHFRNAFENYLKSPSEFRSIIINKLRNKEISLEMIINRKLIFVGSLIGKDKADKLSEEELAVFSDEAEKIIVENEKMISGAESNLRDDASRLGIDPDCIEDHLND